MKPPNEICSFKQIGENYGSPQVRSAVCKKDSNPFVEDLDLTPNSHLCDDGSHLFIVF